MTIGKFLKTVTHKLANLLPDKIYLKLLFRKRTGKRLDLTSPDTFNEKLQWLKLYDRKPIYTTMVDKYLAKQYVANIIGEEYIIPTIGVWEKFDDIDFNSLPNQFVLKCTHDSGGLVICRNKSKFDKDAARKKIERSLSKNYYWHGREWPYKNIHKRIIAESYMEDSETEELRDYKFFCFDGVVRAMFVATDRGKTGEEVKFDFFDAEYNHLPIKQGHPNANTPPSKPNGFEEMKSIAAKLSKGFPHLRIDFYEANNQIYFGEITFFHFAGLKPFEPSSWDKTFGDWLVLPKRRQTD